MVHTWPNGSSLESHQQAHQKIREKGILSVDKSINGIPNTGISHSSDNQKSPINDKNNLINLAIRMIASIDEKIQQQLDEIIHHKRFQALESAWRGVWYLVVSSAELSNIKIKLLSITWMEITKDIDRVIDIEHSQLFQRIYNEEFGTPGGEPFGVLLGDYHVSHVSSKKNPYDINTLNGLAQIASASFCPFITAASPQLLGLDAYNELERPINLDNIFTSSEYVSWHKLRKEEDTRFIGLVLPRILMRPPYQYPQQNHQGLCYREQIANDQDNMLWGNACYAFGSILMREFSQIGWFSHIRGAPRNKLSGGIITDLVKTYLETDRRGLVPNISTDIVITDNTERQLNDLGFIALSQCFGTPYLAFHSNSSIHNPHKSNDLEYNINTKLSSMLQHILCGARIAHYIKVMIRDKVGSFLSANDCQKYLQNWLFQYTTARTDLPWEEQARYPLKEAKVMVNENLEKPGYFWCEIKLKPHYQADQMVSELKIVTEMNQAS